MKKMLFSLSLAGAIGLAGSAFAADLAPAYAPPPPPPSLFPVFPVFAPTFLAPVVVQLGPTTAYSTINCANFAKAPDGSWKALNPTEFGLGFTMHIVPTVVPIKAGGFIYNNVDLYSQLEAQCGYALVRARY